MIEELKTLVALHDLKTMLKTATYLRISQSTVSKRIQNLEALTDQSLIYPNGRRVELTEYGQHLAINAPRILQDLEALLLPHPNKHTDMPKLVIGIGESILTSWAARSVARFEKKQPNTKLEVHAHRAQVIVDKILSGEFHLGLTALKDVHYEGLHFEEVHREPFVLIPSGLKAFKHRRGQILEVVTIESSAHSWKQIRNQARELGISPTRRLETFFAAAQLAINGFGHGLVPEGTAEALGVLNKCERSILGKNLSRKIGLFGRKTILSRPEVRILRKIMIERSLKSRRR